MCRVCFPWNDPGLDFVTASEFDSKAYLLLPKLSGLTTGFLRR
jgi:hypothetical protein